MKVSWKWLKELVSVDITPAAAAALLTGAGLEVESAADLDKGLDGVVTGRILAVTPHPQADKLVVAEVDAGGAKPLTIVTGAPNVRPGQCVPVALPGARLPGGRHPEISRTQLRGVWSEGMMCGGDELGLEAAKLTPEEKEGLYPLPADTAPGQPIAVFLGLDDTVLDIGLTPNRSDCLGMINVARELSALTGGELTLPEIPASSPGGDCARLAQVAVEEEDALCERFGARLVTDIQVGPSPLWMRQRLRAMGMRPINNLVDISNIVMLERNRPLHFFDFDKLAGRGLWVRRAKAGETIVTLDGQTRALTEEMSLVTDQDGPVAIAGVMGGARTEVTAGTTRIMIEAACWNGPRTRKTSQALGLRSEASLRFEKGVDAEDTVAVLDRAVALIEACQAGKGAGGHIDIYPRPQKPTETWVSLARINEVLGTEMGRETADGVWRALRIPVLWREDDRWLLEAPAWRKDLRIEEDYIEEAARFYGYDRLAATLPWGAGTQGYRLPGHQLRRRLAAAMISEGYQEIINYSFINPAHLDRLGAPADHVWRRAVPLKNPLSEEQAILRTTELPGMIQRAVFNINRRVRDLRLFELGKIYLAGPEPGQRPEERWTLAALCTGVQKKTWRTPELPLDFYALKGAVEAALAAVGIREPVFQAASDIPGLHPGRAARVLAGGRELGYLGEVDPQVAAAYDAGQRLVAASLDVAELLAAAAPAPYRPLSRYPEVTRDLAVALPVGIPAAAAAARNRGAGGVRVRVARPVLEFKGDPLGKG
ncbi:MAG: phenylalanine--tRNA ligase subunit beta, partial [Peptococcaceae bacterium]|nr:phenylalanine--tRNA ligase subunit beta [Peptococcaceae bacterium]